MAKAYVLMKVTPGYERNIVKLIFDTSIFNILYNQAIARR